MCNLYSMTTTKEAMRKFPLAFDDRGVNMPSLPGIYPDYAAPIIRNNAGTRELAIARWGLPSPSYALEGKDTDPGVTNVRNTIPSHWRRWLGVENRCLVPFTSFSEPEPQPDGSRAPVWFAFDGSRPLAFFAAYGCISGSRSAS
jgi:putative SOS response-associated peptidase YedK